DSAWEIERLARIVLQIFARKFSFEVIPSAPALSHPADRRPVPARVVRHQLVEQRRHGPAGDDEPRGAGVNDLLQPGRRAGSVERHIDAIGLQNAEDSDERRGSFGDQKAYAIASPASGFFEKTGQTVGGPLHLDIAHPLLLENNRCMLGASLGLSGPQLL